MVLEVGEDPDRPLLLSSPLLLPLEAPRLLLPPLTPPFGADELEVEVGELSSRDPLDEELEVEEAEDEKELGRRASEMLASVVRPQFGSTSRARLLI